MHRLTVFKHNIVCDVNNVVDGAYSAGAQSFPHTARGGLDADVLDNCAAVAVAAFRVKNVNGKVFINISAAAFNLRLVLFERYAERCRSLARKTDYGKAVRSV